MSTLTEIENAAESLPVNEKQELMLFLLTRLRRDGWKLPAVRDIPKERIEKWIADDEAGYQDFLTRA